MDGKVDLRRRRMGGPLRPTWVVALVRPALPQLPTQTGESRPKKNAKNWKRKTREIQHINLLIQKAEKGDTDAMEKVATGYAEGKNGFVRDDHLAYTWFQKAHAAGSVFGMAMVGSLMASGKGVEPNEQEGILHLAMAVGEGSDWAAYTDSDSAVTINLSSGSTSG